MTRIRSSSEAILINLACASLFLGYSSCSNSCSSTEKIIQPKASENQLEVLEASIPNEWAFTIDFPDFGTGGITVSKAYSTWKEAVYMTSSGYATFKFPVLATFQSAEATLDNVYCFISILNYFTTYKGLNYESFPAAETSKDFSIKTIPVTNIWIKFPGREKPVSLPVISPLVQLKYPGRVENPGPFLNVINEEEFVSCFMGRVNQNNVKELAEGDFSIVDIRVQAHGSKKFLLDVYENTDRLFDWKERFTAKETLRASVIKNGIGFHSGCGSGDPNNLPGIVLPSDFESENGDAKRAMTPSELVSKLKKMASRFTKLGKPIVMIFDLRYKGHLSYESCSLDMEAWKLSDFAELVEIAKSMHVKLFIMVPYLKNV